MFQLLSFRGTLSTATSALDGLQCLATPPAPSTRSSSRSTAASMSVHHGSASGAALAFACSSERREMLLRAIHAVELCLNWTMLLNGGILRKGDCCSDDARASQGAQQNSFDNLITSLALAALRACQVLKKTKAIIFLNIAHQTSYESGGDGARTLASLGVVEFSHVVTEALSLSTILVALLIATPLREQGATPASRIFEKLPQDAFATTEFFGEWLVSLSGDGCAPVPPECVLSSSVDGDQFVCVILTVYALLEATKHSNASSMKSFFQAKYLMKYVMIALTFLKQQPRLAVRLEANSDATLVARFRQLRYFRFVGCAAVNLIRSLYPQLKPQEQEVVFNETHSSLVALKLCRQFEHDVKTSARELANCGWLSMGQSGDEDSRRNGFTEYATEMPSGGQIEIPPSVITEEVLLVSQAAVYVPLMNLLTVGFGGSDKLFAGFHISDTHKATLSSSLLMLLRDVCFGGSGDECKPAAADDTHCVVYLSAVDSAHAARRLLESGALMGGASSLSQIPSDPQQIGHQIEDIFSVAATSSSALEHLVDALCDKDATMLHCLHKLIYRKVHSRQSAAERAGVSAVPHNSRKVIHHIADDEDDDDATQDDTALSSPQLLTDDNVEPITRQSTILHAPGANNPQLGVSLQRAQPHSTPFAGKFHNDVAALQQLFKSLEQHSISCSSQEQEVLALRKQLRGMEAQHAEDVKRLSLDVLHAERERDVANAAAASARAKLLEESAAHSAQVSSLNEAARQRNAQCDKQAEHIEQLELRIAKFEQMNQVIRKMTGQLSSASL